MVGSIKSYLTTFQKKTDFRPDDQAVPGQTEACQKVVGYIVECRRVFDQSLDGKNLEVVLLEFGIRIQRVIYDHIQQYVVSETGRNVFDSDMYVCCSLSLSLFMWHLHTGAMNIICDVNEYRRAIKDFKVNDAICVK